MDYDRDLSVLALATGQIKAYAYKLYYVIWKPHDMVQELHTPCIVSMLFLNIQIYNCICLSALSNVIQFYDFSSLVVRSNTLRNSIFDA